MTVLPDGWCLQRLDEVAEVRLGRQRSPKNHAGTSMRPYLRAANVTWNGLDLRDVKRMNFTDTEMAVYRLTPGDILLSEASGSPGEVGKPALWSGEFDECAFQNTLIRVRPSRVSPKYLFHFLRYQALVGRFVPESRGVGINHLGRGRLAGWLTPVPSPDEQRRIVEILEEHLSRLDAATRDLTHARAKVKNLQTSRWLDIFGELEARFGRVDLVDAATIENGQTPRGLDVRLSSVRSGNDVPFFKVGDMNGTGGRVMAQSRSYVSRTDAERLGLRIRAGGCVLIPKRGGAIGTNKKRILTQDAAFDLNTMGLRPRPELSVDYLWHWFQGIDLGEIADGSNIPQLNARQINALALPVPPIATQQAACAELDRSLDADERLDSTCRRASDRSGSLCQALLHAAFSGRLSGRQTDVDRAEE
ncbi:MAG: restriction endonuclease subunit S [Kineosporiaceae bacterium]